MRRSNPPAQLPLAARVVSEIAQTDRQQIPVASSPPAMLACTREPATVCCEEMRLAKPRIADWRFLPPHPTLPSAPSLPEAMRTIVREALQASVEAPAYCRFSPPDEQPPAAPRCCSEPALVRRGRL